MIELDLLDFKLNLRYRASSKDATDPITFSSLGNGVYMELLVEIFHF
jgi:hypothetical protein